MTVEPAWLYRWSAGASLRAGAIVRDGKTLTGPEPAKKNPHAVTLGRRGGRVSSPAKTAAARENGRKGGRPRKRPVE